MPSQTLIHYLFKFNQKSRQKVTLPIHSPLNQAKNWNIRTEWNLLYQNLVYIPYLISKNLITAAKQRKKVSFFSSCFFFPSFFSYFGFRMYQTLWQSSTKHFYHHYWFFFSFMNHKMNCKRENKNEEEKYGNRVENSSWTVAVDENCGWVWVS